MGGLVVASNRREDISFPAVSAEKKIDTGHIAPSNSLWNTSVSFIKKKSGK